MVQALATNTGMAHKWFRVFPTHVRVMRECFGESARRQRMWCFDSGATIATGLAMAICADVPGLLTDRLGRLTPRYDRVSRALLAQKGPDLAELSGAPADRVEELMAATAGRSGTAALVAVRMAYSPSHEAATGADWAGTIGYVFSAGTLEHYSPEDLEAEVSRMATALAPGGVLSHVVDHRDHRWHADKRLSPLAHLTIGDDEYRRRFASGLDYHNRWLRSDYVRLFRNHGFEATCHDVIAYTLDLAPLDRARLAERFAHASDDDLNALVTHFVAVRSGRKDAAPE
jgi:hypothetical protein